MQKLTESIKKNGFTYNQIIRGEEIALYEQLDADNAISGHEVFKIKTMKAGNVFGTEMPEREVYPKNEDFGVTAWSVGMSREKAVERFFEKKAQLNLE